MEAADTDRIKEDVREKSAPVCVRCGIARPSRVLILSCSFVGSALLWGAFSLPTWAKVQVPGGSQVLFSALFAVCSGEVACWLPLSKSNCFTFGRVCMVSALLLSLLLSSTLLAFPQLLPDTRKQYFVFTAAFSVLGVCVFLALLLHSLHVLDTAHTVKGAKITFLYPSFMLSLSASLFFVAGALCSLSAHRCWLQCILPRPIHVQPKPTSPATGPHGPQRASQAGAGPASAAPCPACDPGRDGCSVTPRGGEAWPAPRCCSDVDPGPGCPRRCGLGRDKPVKAWHKSS